MDDQTAISFNYDVHTAMQLEYAEIVSERTINVNVNNKYTLYRIHIKKRPNEESRPDEFAERRFSDFEMLHRRLKEEKRGLILPALPAKNMVSLITMGSDEKRKARTKALELYLNKLMTNQQVWDSAFLGHFLSDVR